MRPSRILFVILLQCFAAAAAPVRSQAAQPRLVVALLVDQLRYDYIERQQPLFSKGGFVLLSEKGAFLTFAHYPYAPTVTGPGHASFLSGAPPSMHGIIGNEWFDRRTRTMVNCVSDPDVLPVGAAAAPGRSPRLAMGSNLADEMRMRFGSKVVGLSLKDRGAILPAGRKPLGAYWFDSPSGNFITSTYYRPELPRWLEAFNARKLPRSYMGQAWTRLLPLKDYTGPAVAAGAAALPGEKAASFDHTVVPSPTEGFETLVPTPFGNQLLVDLALAAVEGEKLGGGEAPDLLTVSFSSLDACGHRFGPASHEIQDMMLRLDRELERLFQGLDRAVGLQNVWLVLTADHGVAPTPEDAQEQGLGGLRADLGALTSSLLAYLESKFGPGRFLLTPRIVEGNLYFDHEALAERNLAADEVAAAVRTWALDSGRFLAAFTRSQLLDGRAPGRLGERILNGFHAERSGDVVLVQKPFQIPAGARGGTTHGSPFSYDTHVPVFFYGAPFKPGRCAESVSVTDIVPTLSSALRMNEPALSIGKPVTAVLRATALEAAGTSGR
jgi:hypothetical protein